MASLLDFGGGASEGLDTVLARMLLEARQQETQRSNQADEKLRGRGIDEAAASRDLAQRGLQQSQAATEEDRAADNVRGILAMRPAGREVTPQQYKYETNHGAPDDFFLKERKYPEDFVGPTEDDRDTEKITFQGVRTPGGSPESSQMKTVLYKGKPVDASYNPRDQSLTYQGQDITKDASHYEEPKTPQFLQSGSGYITKEEAARMTAQGKEVPLATTSSTRTMSEGAQMLAPHIKAIGEQAQALDKAGLFGPVMSRVRDILSKVGTIQEFDDAVSSDPELNKDKMVGKFATTLGLLASGAGRVHGGARGGGSTQMLQYFKNMLSDSSTLEMFMGRIEGVDDYMQGYAAGPPGSKPSTGAPAAAPAGDSAYDRYLKRTAQGQ